MQVETNKSQRWRVVFEKDGMVVEKVVKPIEQVTESEIKEFLVEAEIVEKQPTIQLYNKEAETYELPQKSYTLNKHI